MARKKITKKDFPQFDEGSNEAKRAPQYKNNNNGQKKAEQEILRLKDEVAQKAEDKYRTLFNSIDEAFVIYELIYDEAGKVVDIRLEEANPAHERETGLKNVVGKTSSELGINTEYHWLEKFDHVVKTGESLRYENFHAQFQRWYDVFISRVGEAGSTRMAMVFSNITERKQRELHHEFLLSFSDNLRAELAADAVANRALQMLIEYLRLDRSYIVSYYLDKNIALLDYQIGNETVPPLPDTFDLSHYPEAYKTVLNQTLVIEDDFERQGLSEDEKQNSAKLGMRAMVAATVRKGENKPLWSMVAINSKPRHWTPHEVQLVEEVAERTWTAIQRAKGEEALRQNEEKYRTLFNSIDEGFQLYEVLYDNTGKPVDFRYLETNPAFEQQTGLKNVAGKLGSEVIPNLESYWFDYFEEILKSPEPLHTENYHEATGRWYSASSFRAFNDGRPIIGALFTDITERKLREQQLAKDLADTTQLQQVSSAFLEAKDSDSLYRKIMDAAQAIMQSDMASIQVFVPEKNALKLIGYKNFHPESARLWEWVEADTGSVWGLALTENKRVIVPDIETEFIKDADALHVHALSGIRAVQSTPLISRSGKIIGMFSTHWTKIHEPSERDLRLLDVLARQAGDLIEKKQAEDALRQSEEKLKQFNIQLEQQVKERTQELNEKNKQLQHTVSQLESFNYIASHDLQEPLRKIQTFVELLNENEISDAEKQEYLAGINVSSARMSDLINSLLQYSRLSRARDAFQPVDLNITLLNVKTDYEIAINEKHGIIESDHLPTVPAIPFQMHQLFANLISNSLKFCERQPQINISSRIVAGNEIKTENQLNDKIKYAELIFRDNGIGFDNKYSKKIFEVFQRLHNQSAYSGTGIGLSIVHKIVKQHNGFIKAEGEKERGSVFTVYLPVV